jgi:hypothetical protein
LISGGGGGGANGGDHGLASFPGNGGKSWMNQDFVAEEVLRQDGGTARNPRHGYAKYQIQKN